MQPTASAQPPSTATTIIISTTAAATSILCVSLTAAVVALLDAHIGSQDGKVTHNPVDHQEHQKHQHEHTHHAPNAEAVGEATVVVLSHEDHHDKARKHDPLHSS
jgi:hypothetical protein